MQDPKITLRHELVSSAAASAILAKERYDRQRPINHSYINQYALAMQKKEFREGTVISFCVFKGSRYLINGQHTLHAIVLAATPYLLGIEEIPVKSYEEIALWYSRYDRVHMRTLEHAYYAHNMQEHVQLNKGQTTQLGGCLPSLASGFEPVPRTHGGLRMYLDNPEIRMAFIGEWRDEAEAYFRDIKGAPGRMNTNLRRGPVMAVALVTYRYTGADATEFWHQTAMADRLANNDPRDKLHVFLLTTTSQGGYEPYIMSRIVASAWNLAWKDSKLKGLPVGATNVPIRLEGTPHTVRKVLRYLSPQGDVLHDPEEYRPDAWHVGLLTPKEDADA
jgi:hypothetical protein